VRVLAFSDLHCDLDGAERLVEASREVDAIVGAGDFASVHSGLEETIDALRGIERPTLLVPGNNETEDALREATAAWPAATVLHGEATELDGRSFFGLGAGIPITPWEWSFDLDEPAAEAMLADCPGGAVLIVHSPPRGHVDRDSSGRQLGSEAVRDAIEAKAPPLALCGHIHESWETESRLGPTRIVNLGPRGTVLEV
jgi:uncharacterized protein